MTDFCPNFQMIAVSYNDDKNIMARLRCKQWSCEYCAKINAKSWYACIMQGMTQCADDVWSMITITMPAWIHRKARGRVAWDRAHDSIEFIRKNWDKLMKRLKRWLGAFDYVRILESHRSGVIHIHLLLNTIAPDVYFKQRKVGDCYWHSDTLASHLKAVGFGYIHDAKPLGVCDETPDTWHRGAIAGYVAKYLTKDSRIVDGERKASRIRKVQASRRFKAPKADDAQLDWQLKSGVFIEDVMQASAERKHWLDINTGEYITLDDYEDNLWYPSELK